MNRNKPYAVQQRQKLMASAWVDKSHRDKWEFIEKRLHRAMTLDELKDYIGYVDRRGKFLPPKQGFYAVPPGVELSESNGDKMPDEDREALLRLCFESKTGRPLTDGEQGFCGRMLKWFPEEYRVVHTKACKQAEQTVNPLAAQTCDVQHVSYGDECPLCHNGTVEIVDDEVRCRGECGAVWTLGSQKAE